MKTAKVLSGKNFFQETFSDPEIEGPAILRKGTNLEKKIILPM